ncbi:DUF2946 domain-containing protein [Paraherbaspirillum soli]|uniref:DUF2946 domain-containing protein n=1 Tax=Paraherbaspirillum soli TaxID=631222 RepID=A0ABW0MA13_9BURK
MNRSTRRFASWIACFAILLASLAPSISHAIAAAQGGTPWIEICTTGGNKFVPAADGQDPSSPTPAEHGIHLEHCPFCFTHGGSLGLPPADALTVPAVSGTSLLPSLFYQSSHPLFAWSAAQPRAPPAVS